MSFLSPPNIKNLMYEGNIKSLTRALNHRTLSVRLSAAQALIALLQKQIYTGTDKYVLSEKVIEALKNIHSRRMIEAIVDTLQDKSSSIRCGAALALGVIQSTKTVEPLIASLQDKSSNVRINAANALGIIGDKSAINPLKKLLNNKNGNVRKSAIAALAEIGTNQALEPLIKSLHDPEQNVRICAANGLKKLNWIPGNDVNGAQYWVIEQNWDQCVRIGTIAIDPLLIELNVSDKSVRKEIFDTLEKIGWQPTNDVIGALFWILKGDFERCIEIGADAVVPLLAAMHEKGKNNQEKFIAVFKKMGSTAVKPLITALNDESWKIRGMAADTLGQIGDSSAATPLIETLKDDKKSVVTKAAKALVNLYHSDSISEAAKKRILTKRETISYHHDLQPGCGQSNHIDNGIGVLFPL